MTNPPATARKTSTAWTVATWFGAGFFPWGPGTAGSLGAILIAVAIQHWLHPAPWLYAALALVLTPPSIWASTITAREAGRKDPGIVVVDEVLGQWLTLAGATHLNWKAFLAAFLVFRALDILKPYPARRFEKLPEGAGIVADDLMAGLYGALVLRLAGWFNLY